MQIPNEIAYKAQAPSYIQKNLRILAALMLKTANKNSNSKFMRLPSLVAKKIRAMGIKSNRSIYDLIKTINLKNSVCQFDADVILTHDVDWKECWDCHEKIADWEEEFGFSSTFCYLTNGPYKISNYKLNELSSRGFGIGLHGEWHDIAIGYRTKKRIQEFINRSITGLGRMPVMFRSPALSVSETLFEVLHEVGIQRDSSIPAWSPYYPACSYPSPFKYTGLTVIEYPLALQDDFLFRDLSLTDETALDFTLALLNLFKQREGVFVLNTHPGIVIKHEKFYKGFLNSCKQNNLRVKVIMES